LENKLKNVELHSQRVEKQSEQEKTRFEGLMKELEMQLEAKEIEIFEQEKKNNEL